MNDRGWALTLTPCLHYSVPGKQGQVKRLVIRNCQGFLLRIKKISSDSVVSVHGDGGGVDISDGVHIASPVDKLVASISLGHQVEHRFFSLGKSPLSKDGYRATGGAGGGEVVLNLRSNRRCPSSRVKVGGD